MTAPMIPMVGPDDLEIRDYIPGQPIPAIVKDPKTGKFYVNPLKKFVVPFTLSINPQTLELTGGQSSNYVPMPLDGKGHFEIVDALFHSTQPEAFTVELFLPNDSMGVSSFAPRPFLMNREIHVATMASGMSPTLNYETITTGNAGRKFRWPETYFVNVETGTRVIFARFRNLSSSTATIRFALHGRRWYHTVAPSKVADRMQAIYRSRFRTFPFFFTTAAEVVLDALGTDTPYIRLDDMSWTEIHKMMRVSDGNFLCRIVEDASDKRLMDLAMRDDLVFGEGEFPFLLWEPALFEPNYRLNFELEDLSDDTNNVYITLAGRKIMFDPEDDRLLRPGMDTGGKK